MKYLVFILIASGLGGIRFAEGQEKDTALQTCCPINNNMSLRFSSKPHFGHVVHLMLSFGRHLPVDNPSILNEKAGGPKIKVSLDYMDLRLAELYEILPQK